MPMDIASILNSPSSPSAPVSSSEDESGPAAQRRRLDESGSYTGLTPRNPQTASSASLQQRRRQPVNLRIDTGQAIGPTVPGSSTLTTSQVAAAQVPRPVAPAGATEVQAIHAAVRGPFSSKTKHYEAILDANAANPPDLKWSHRSMVEAAGIADRNARTIDARRAPDTPNTAEVRAFLESTRPTDNDDTMAGRYRRALDRNDARPEQRKWPDKSMRKASGIAGSQARDILRLRAPDTPRTAEVRAFLERSRPENQPDLTGERLRRAIDHNDTRPPNEKWPDESMIKAAGIDTKYGRSILYQRMPDSPRTAAIRAELDGSAPTGTETLTARCQRALELNAARPANDQWRVKSMWKAVGIDPAHAREVRLNWRPNSGSGGQG